MNTEKIETNECPHCDSSLIIPNGWIIIKNNRIVSIDADWRCPECGEIGKVDIGGTTNDHWQPREIGIGQDIPQTPRTGELERGTPERRAVEFLDYWKQDVYKGMADLIPPNEDVLNQNAPEVIKEYYHEYELKHFVLQAVDNVTPVIATVIAQVYVDKPGTEISERIEVGIVREDEEGNVDPDGKWYFMDWPKLG